MKRNGATSSKLQATSRRTRADLKLVPWSLSLSIHIAQRPPPALSGPPLAGVPAAVAEDIGARPTREAATHCIAQRARKGSTRGKLRLSVFPSWGAGATAPQETIRVTRYACVAQCGSEGTGQARNRSQPRRLADRGGRLLHADCQWRHRHRGEIAGAGRRTRLNTWARLEMDIEGDQRLEPYSSTRTQALLV